MKFDFEKIFKDFDDWFPRKRHWIDVDEIEVIKDRLQLCKMSTDDLKNIFDVVCSYENKIFGSSTPNLEENWVEKLDKYSAIKAVINIVYKELAVI